MPKIERSQQEILHAIKDQLAFIKKVPRRNLWVKSTDFRLNRPLDAVKLNGFFQPEYVQ